MITEDGASASQEADGSGGFDISYYASLLMRRSWIMLCAALLSGFWMGMKSSKMIPVYQATALILIDKEVSPRSYNEAVKSETAGEDYYQTQFKLLKSRSLLKKAYDSLGLMNTPQFAEPNGLDKLIGAVTVTPIRATRLINLTVDSDDPQLAARVSNAIAGIYVKQNMEDKLFISKQMLQNFFGRFGEESKSLETLPMVVKSPVVQQLYSNYDGLKFRLQELSQRYTSQHPDIVALKSQMRATQARIEEEVGKNVESMKAEFSGFMISNNVRIIDLAEVPQSPYKPNKKKMMTSAILAGLIIGCVMVLGLDYMDRNIYSQEDVEKVLRQAFLGFVPKSAAFRGDTGDDYRQLLISRDSFISDSIKNIRTMIGFAAAGQQMKRLLITSTHQSEGKSFLAINLAFVFTLVGEKVLLIEGDMRRPYLHKPFGLSTERGLTHFLAHGKDAAELSELVQKTDNPDLDVLVCGQIPPNPLELLSTPGIKALMGWAQAYYDRIIIDGTPIFPVSDALLWGREADAAVFVACFGSVNLSLAGKACNILKGSVPKILGVVINGVSRKTGYYGNYHYYRHYKTQPQENKAA
ncbi:MAG: polysaccharide biosynthesis tyrosine autokinase [Elusimicrobia bacterium]|nr:polysaccharide biosynthesis tyrosine autokinase [Elusimicrobiota bacterium]